MKTIDSTYQLEQQIWEINSRSIPVETSCPACEGTGNLIGKNKSILRCPNCYGKKTLITYEDKGWHVVDRPLTVGQITLTYTKDKQEEEYMCYETGIGSGTIHYTQDTFSSKKEAIAACKKLNKSEEVDSTYNQYLKLKSIYEE